MDTPVDVSALIAEAGLPDTPEARRLVQAVADRCAAICALAQPAGDAAHVSKADAAAVGAELSVEILSRFGLA